MSSAYFNINDQPASSESSLPILATTIKTTKGITQIPTEQTFLPTTAEPQSTQGGSGGEGSADADSKTRPDGSNTPYSSVSSGGISVGAQAGIAVGIGVVVITSIICGVMWCRYLKKKQRALEEWQSAALSQQHESPAYHDERNLAQDAPQPYQESKVICRNTDPVEIG
ncbi:hypothetical protein LY78DRAFT_374594 [Colletotrichum sublineola]|nr:hypothetical protein LY78DRAFT_374594 [Colletotrichum sublineola]